MTLVSAESKENSRTVLEFFAITEQSAKQPGPQRDGAGAVRDFRIETEPDEDRESDQRAAPGNGIDHARCECGAEHGKPGERRIRQS